MYLNHLLFRKFEEEDDFSDVEEDFNKFMEEAARKFKN